MLKIPNVWRLFAIRLFANLIPAYVIERLYWEERGMTVQMVVYAEIIYAAAIVLLELPTGIVADRWGRKGMLIVAACMGCAEFLLLVFATQFWYFALVVLLAAVGRSASSGAEQALLYDSLLAAGKASRFEQLLGRLNALDLLSVIAAALSGSFLASRYGYTLNYWISLASACAALLFTLGLREPEIRSGGVDEDESDPLPIRAYLAVSLRFFREHPGVRLAVLSGMIAGAAVNFIDEFWQTYLDRVGVPVAYFGLFSASIFLLRLPGSMLAYRLKDRFRYGSLLAGIACLFAACFVYLSVARGGYSGLAAIGLICLASGVIEPLVAGYLHHRADSAMRATIGSFQSLGEHAAVSLIGLGFGYFSASFDIFGGYGFVGVVCGVYVVYLAFASRALQREHMPEDGGA